MDKVQSCQTEDTCSQQEPCLWTAKSFVTVPREAMIFPSGITSTNLATVFKYLLPYKIHIGIKAGDAQMQKGRRPLQITSALCHTSFWNSFSLETGSWQISSLISDTRSVRGKVTSLYRVYITYFTGDKISSTCLPFHYSPAQISSTVTEQGVDNSCYGLIRLCPCFPLKPPLQHSSTQHGTASGLLGTLLLKAAPTAFFAGSAEKVDTLVQGFAWYHFFSYARSWTAGCLSQFTSRLTVVLNPFCCGKKEKDRHSDNSFLPSHIYFVRAQTVT